MRQLNVTDDSLRASFRRYLKFFNNKERYKAFKAYSLTTCTEDTLDIAVLSVLCKLPYPGLEEVLMALLAEYALAGRLFTIILRSLVIALPSGNSFANITATNWNKRPGYAGTISTG